MIRSVRNLAALDPGFDPESVLAVHASIPRTTVASADAATAPASRPVVEGRVLLDRLRAIPGVKAVTLGNGLPLDGDGGASFYSAEGQPAVNAQNMPRIYVHRITPDFFETLRIPIVAGRTFNENEISPTSPAVIVSEGVVKRFWPGQDPIGKRVKFGGLASQNPWLSIVGVVGEVKFRGLPQNPTADPDIYLPFADRNSLVAIALRTTVEPTSVVAPVRAAIRAADRSIAVYNISTLDDLVSAQTSASRFTMWLMGVFAAIALALAVVGIYGVMSYLVTQRTREIGIRLALGANARDILQLVVASGAKLIAAGIVIGVAGAFALERLVRSLLFGVTTADAASVVAIVVLAIVALAACYLPAARASRVDPLRALRYE
jgi:putative ABC transport system permease protein